MKKFETLNLEIGRPIVDAAIDKFYSYFNVYKKTNVECILIIHGYGSHGKGGQIRDTLRDELEKLKKSGMIKLFINGEDFKITNSKAYELRYKYEELKNLFHMTNRGVTVVVIK